MIYDRDIFLFCCIISKKEVVKKKGPSLVKRKRSGSVIFKISGMIHSGKDKVRTPRWTEWI
jgi:hypothetical protein